MLSLTVKITYILTEIFPPSPARAPPHVYNRHVSARGGRRWPSIFAGGSCRGRPHSKPTNAAYACTPWRRRVEAASSFPAEPSRPACRAEHASPPSWSRETKPPLHDVCLPSAARARVGDTVPRHRRAMLLRHPIPLLLAAPWTTCNSAFNPLALGSTVPSAARRSHPAHPWHGHRPAALSGVRIRRGADGRSDAALIERTSRCSAVSEITGIPIAGELQRTHARTQWTQVFWCCKMRQRFLLYCLGI